jgi:hypothetical protein
LAAADTAKPDFGKLDFGQPCRSRVESPQASSFRIFLGFTWLFRKIVYLTSCNSAALPGDPNERNPPKGAAEHTNRAELLNQGALPWFHHLNDIRLPWMHPMSSR